MVVEHGTEPKSALGDKKNSCRCLCLYCGFFVKTYAIVCIAVHTCTLICYIF